LEDNQNPLFADFESDSEVKKKLKGSLEIKGEKKLPKV